MIGPISWFGGPFDDTMKPWEGLAFFEHHEADKRPDLFLPRSSDLEQGCSKRLRCNDSYYLALNIQKGISRNIVRASRWKLINPDNSHSVICQLIDRGPGAAGRLVDASRAAMRAIGLHPDNDTDKMVEVVEYTDFAIRFGIYGWEEKEKNKEV